MNIKNIAKITMILILFPAVLFSLSGAVSEEPDLIPEYVTFSPDGNGIKDEIRFFIRSDLNLHPVDWTFSIQMTGGDTIRVMRADHRKIRVGRKLSNYFLPEDTELEPLALPSEISWNGRDQNGRIVSEGAYIARLAIKLDDGKAVELTSKPVIADMTPVRLELIARSSVILRYVGTDRPEKNYNVVIDQKTSETNAIHFRGEIRNIFGDIIYTNASSNELPAVFNWDGKDGSDDAADYGVYSYVLTAEDSGGNQSSVSFNDILVRSGKTGLDLRTDHISFSPDGDGRHDTVKFQIVPVPEQTRYYGDWNNKLNVRGWKFFIYDKDRITEVYTIKDRSKFPEFLQWDGKRDNGLRLKEGIYFARVLLDTSYGEIDTGYRPVRLDLTPPELDLDVTDSHFAPDGDGEDEYIRINYDLEDISGVESWKITIFTESDDGKLSDYDYAYRIFEGKGSVSSGSLIWNGEDDRGRRPHSFEKFRIVIETSDLAGNRIKLNKGMLYTNVIILPEKPGNEDLIISFPDQGYFTADGSITGKGKDVLDAFLDRFKRYRTYKIRVETHTGAIGSERENILRTETESRNIANYLITSGIPQGSVVSVGSGESEPVEAGKSQYADYRNRRMQLRLIPGEIKKIDPGI